MSDQETKLKVARAFKFDNQSKASLALQYDVSPRTITRWIDAVEESGVELLAPTASKADVAKDTRYLDAYWKRQETGKTSLELADEFGVSDSTVRRWLKRAREEIDGGVVQTPKEETNSPAPVPAAKAVTGEVNYRYQATSKSITLTQLTHGKITGSVSVDRSNETFDETFDDLIKNEFSVPVLGKHFDLLQPAKALEKFSQGKVQVDPSRNEIYYVADEDTVPYKVNGKLTNRILDLIRQGDVGYKTLVNFLEKLMENPSRRAVEELYGFLDANDIVICEDGFFYAWKKVASNFMDIHSGTISNAVGTSPRVARNMVDENSNVTCSYGLHVCSKSYLRNFGSGGGGDRVVKVKVNPADVVAIPADYNNAKMRCCGYEVIEDVTGKI